MPHHYRSGDDHACGCLCPRALATPDLGRPSRPIRRLMADPQTLLGVGLVLATTRHCLIGDDLGQGTAAGVAWRVIGISVEFLAAQAIAAIAAPHLRPTATQRAMIGVAPVRARDPLRRGRHGASPERRVPATGSAVHPDRRPRRGAGHAPGAPRRRGRDLALLPAGAVGGSGQPHDRCPAGRRPRRHRHPAVHRDPAIDLCPDGHRPPARNLARPRSAPNAPGRRRRERRTAARRDRPDAGDAGADRRAPAGRPRLRLRLHVSRRLEPDPDRRPGWVRHGDRRVRWHRRRHRPGHADLDPCLRPRRDGRPRLPERLGHRPRGDQRPADRRGELIGIVNVEARAAADLDASDVETMRLVAERMASALALARRARAARRPGGALPPADVVRDGGQRHARSRAASTRRSSTSSSICSGPTRSA